MIWMFYLKVNSQPKGHKMVGARWMLLGQSGNINPYEEKSLNPTLCCPWVEGVVQYLRGLLVLLALESNETEEDHSKKQNDCFTPARQETHCKLKRRGYEEHLQLSICPVLLLCLSLHHLPPRLSCALHLPVLPLYLSPLPYVHSHTQENNNLFPSPQCGSVLACQQSTLTYLAATGADW